MYGVPPFDIIEEVHFIPAIQEGIRVQNEEIGNIINNPDQPSFENTIEAIEYSGQIIKRAASVMFNLSFAHTNPQIQSMMQEVAPSLSAHSDGIFMNPALFDKVKVVYQNKEKQNLNPEQIRLLEEFYKTFVRNGANLNDQDKKRLQEINQRLSIISLQFGQNILAVINEYQLVVENINDLAGLPENIIAAAKETAEEKDLKDKWVFTLQNSSVIPFLQYAENRTLRKEIWQAYTNKGNQGDKNDNKAIILETITLRAEKSKLLGYKTHAHYVLEVQMAKSPDDVQKLLNQLLPPALGLAKKEAQELQKMIDENEHPSFKLEAHDWRYFAEKLRKQKYDLDEEVLKPYFKLQNVQDGIFEVAKKLYSLEFHINESLPKYHKDVKVYEVKTVENEMVGILYIDYFPRDSKQGGAWMTSYVEQKKNGNQRCLPVISIVCNFTKPIGETPSLLTFDEVNTFFHEFGHALHGLLSDVRYQSLSGTNVPTDFVELPSQILENWATEPEVLKNYAKHYITTHVIPQKLLDKLESSSKYGQGFATCEYLAASLLDMAYHSLEDGFEFDTIETYENKVMDKIGLIPEIVARYKSTYFSHIFAGGYSSGYYSYIWSEVLDADAFALFKSKGIFDNETALAFKVQVLEKGNSEDAMQLYINFRGQKPEILPLLEKRGLMAE
jgi:peptidyl-dipeptidase Dcp